MDAAQATLYALVFFFGFGLLAAAFAGLGYAGGIIALVGWIWLLVAVDSHGRR